MNSVRKVYTYPDPDEIKINEANLELRLRDCKDHLKNRPSWSDLLILVPAWAILFTSNFHNILIFSGAQLKGAYSVFMIIGTLLIMVRTIKVLIGNLFKKDFNNVRGVKKILKILFRDEYSPTQLIEDIKNKCGSSN